MTYRLLLISLMGLMVSLVLYKVSSLNVYYYILYPIGIESMLVISGHHRLFDSTHRSTICIGNDRGQMGGFW